MDCPDPSAHRDTKLQEQASTAALFATSPARHQKSATPASDILDKDNKLSSRSAALSLKHARPEDLPSYPTSGGVNTNHSSGAALLAHGNHKTFEHWKPDPSSAAGKAALQAKDYKMAPLWQPNSSAAGSKAALAAHKDGAKVDIWTPEASAHGNSAAAQAFKKGNPAPAISEPSAWGNTAATQAFKKSAHGPSAPQVSSDVRNKALLAATKSVSRARSGSMPTPVLPQYPDSANSAHNALNAATAATHRPSAKYRADDVMDSPALEESRIRHLSDKIVSREMWTDHPPVDIEVQEKKHQDALRASAISMAKGMYSLAERNKADHTSTAGATAATAAAGRSSTTAPPDIKQQAMQYIHLQEAAHKLAEERLAKMDPDGAARYREHYGYPLRSPRRKLSMKNSTRRRANSEGQLSDSDDEQASRRIRHQMSQFSKEIDAVDQKKRQTDRAALMAAAEKKVQAQMKGMDAKVYAETGKVSPAMMEEWEAKAREKAARNSEKRTENFGKADIGGGRYMDQSEIEAIAAARLKPTLDEINENAEKRRAKDEEMRLDAEEKKRQEVREKQNEKEVKMLQKQTRQEEKAAAKREKAEQKAAAKSDKEQQKAAERARKAEEHHAIKDDKAHDKDVKKDAAVATAAVAGIAGQDVVEDAKKEEHAEPAAHIEGPSEQTKARESIEIPDSDEDDDEDEDGEFIQAEEAFLSPVLERKPTGECVLIPDIERHVTQIEASDSEGDAVHTATVKHDNEKAAIIPATTTTITSPATESSTEGTHVGTDGAINKPTPEAIDILRANNLPSESQTSPDARSPRRITKLLTKLHRRSKPAPESRSGADSTTPASPQRNQHVLTKSRRRGSSPAKQSAAAVGATVSPTDPDVTAFSAATDAQNLSVAAAARSGSPSSFVRHAPATGATRDRSDSDVSSLSSDGPDVPAFRGLVPKKDIGSKLEQSRSPVRDSRFQEEL